MSIDYNLKKLSLVLNNLGYKKHSKIVTELSKQAAWTDYVPGGSYVSSLIGGSEQPELTPEQTAAQALAQSRATQAILTANSLIDINDPSWLYSLTSDGKGYMAYPKNNPTQPRRKPDGSVWIFNNPEGLAKVKAGRRISGSSSRSSSTPAGGLNQPNVDVFQEGTWSDARSGTPRSTQGHEEAPADPQMGLSERVVKSLERVWEIAFYPLAEVVAAGVASGSIPLAIGCFVLHICGYTGTLQVTNPEIRRAVTFIGLSKNAYKDAGTINYRTIKVGQNLDPKYKGSPGPVYMEGGSGGDTLKAGVSNPYSALSLAVGTGKIASTGTGNSQTFVLGDFYNFWTGAEGQRKADLDKYIVNARNLIGGFDTAMKLLEAGSYLGTVEQAMIWRQRITGYNGFQVYITSLSVGEAKGS